MKIEQLTISNSEKLTLISNLSTMITAGIPILEVVDSLLEDAKGNVKKILEIVREDLIQGKHLYISFSRFPLVFDKVTANIVKASEEAGTLDITLKDLKDEIKKDIEFSDKIKTALTYPVIIIFVFFAVLLLILIVVIPKIATVFLRLKVSLPLPTRILIFISNVILTYTIPVIIGFSLFILGLFFLYKKKRQWILHITFTFPIISTLIKQIDLTRFSRSMYLLLTSGITITNALELTQDIVMKPEIAKAITYSKEVVLAGKNLSEGFKENKRIFSGIIVKIIEAGERTGTLDKSMQDISEHLDYEVSNSLKTFTTILEPVMLVFVGILVGGMMLAIIAPIYGLIGQVSVR
jgi:type II secretory pathway component PulF